MKSPMCHCTGAKIQLCVSCMDIALEHVVPGRRKAVPALFTSQENISKHFSSRSEPGGQISCLGIEASTVDSSAFREE